MAIKCAIFDLDGTITDSQALWHEAKRNVMRNRGLTPTKEDERRFAQLELAGSGEYIRDRYLPGLTAEALSGEILDDVTWHYLHTVPLKPGVGELLRRLHGEGVALCIATGSVRERFLPMLERLGVAGLFSHVLTVADVPRNKHHPDIYLLAARLAGAAPAETVVFEDTLYSARAAKEAGFWVVGIHEPASDGSPEEMRALCHWFVEDYRALPGDFPPFL